MSLINTEGFTHELNKLFAQSDGYEKIVFSKGYTIDDGGYFEIFEEDKKIIAIINCEFETESGNCCLEYYAKYSSSLHTQFIDLLDKYNLEFEWQDCATALLYKNN